MQPGDGDVDGVDRAAEALGDLLAADVLLVAHRQQAARALGQARQAMPQGLQPAVAAILAALGAGRIEQVDQLGVHRRALAGALLDGLEREEAQGAPRPAGQGLGAGDLAMLAHDQHEQVLEQILGQGAVADDGAGEADQQRLLGQQRIDRLVLLHAGSLVGGAGDIAEVDEGDAPGPAPRQRLRIGARDLWGEAGTQVVGLELTGLAEAVLQVLLDQALAHQIQRTPDAEAQAALRSIAIIGLGKLGSRELGYASDWDVLFVYEDASRELRDSPGFRAVNAVVEGILAQAQQLKSLGAEIEMDARLRAEGRFGQLARTVSEYRSYYTESAQTWERQVLTRARPVAGARRTAAAYMRAAHRAIYSRALPEEAADEIRAMKRRIERERLKPDEKERDVKLGLGGLTDIEFLTQMWQMRVGHERPSVRASGTLEALQALGTCGVLPAPLVARLVESHGFFTAIRNRLTLAAGIATDVVPTENRRVRSLAIGMGFADSPKQPAEEEFSLKLREHLRDVRRYVEKWFFGE